MKRISILFLTIALAGCAARVKNVTGAPAGVSVQQVQQWDAAVANLQKIATVTTTLRQSVMALNRTGAFPDSDAYAQTLTGIARIDSAQIQASRFLESVPDDWTLPTQLRVQAYIQQIQQALTGLATSGVAGIKNANSQKQVSQLVSELIGDTGAIVSLFASKYSSLWNAGPQIVDDGG